MNWYNIVPTLRRMGLEIPVQLDPDEEVGMSWQKLAKLLPEELAKQELNTGIYDVQNLIPIPLAVRERYVSYRPTPLIRARGLEKALGIRKVKIYYKREDLNQIGSYKLNSAYAQAYYAKEEGASELVGDTGPGNWGMGLAVATHDFGVPAAIYMNRDNYLARSKKVAVMQKYNAEVMAISDSSGTIASSISVAVDRVRRGVKSKLSLGCLSAYSALHNTVIGLELKQQFMIEGVVPSAVIGVVGGGSSFSGLVFPLVEEYKEKIEFIAIESSKVPSFTKGEYRYEHPDTMRLMPRSKMYTLGVDFVPKKTGAVGLNYHGKNPLLSLLVHRKLVKAVAIDDVDTREIQDLFAKTEGVRPSAESYFAIKGAIEKAKILDGKDASIVFLLTGKEDVI